MRRRIAAGFLVGAACCLGAVAAKAGPRGPQSFEATAMERLAISGIQSQQRDLLAQGDEVVSAAKARLGLPPTARFGWDPAAGKWALYADAPAPVVSGP